MKASETRLRALLEGQQHFVVPLFQRPYSWQRNDWETLWNDIIETYRFKPAGGHFLGSIVSKSQPGTPEGVSPYIVIDGQQRLTTLSIVIAALRDRIGKADPAAGERISDLCLINKYAKNEYHYKIRPTQADRPAYFAVIDGDCNSKDEEEPNLIRQAYDFFFDALGKSADEEDDELLDLARLERLILDEVEVVSITLGDNDNEYRIFESLNWKGAPLSQADLLRNYFFMRIPADQQQSLYDSVWVPMQAMLDSKALADFFRYQYMSSGHFVRQKDIYLKWRGDLDRLESGSLAAKMRELAGCAQYYKRLIEPEAEPDAPVRERLERLNRWGRADHVPFRALALRGGGWQECGFGRSVKYFATNRIVPRTTAVLWHPNHRIESFLHGIGLTNPGGTHRGGRSASAVAAHWTPTLAERQGIQGRAAHLRTVRRISARTAAVDNRNLRAGPRTQGASRAKGAHCRTRHAATSDRRVAGSARAGCRCNSYSPLAHPRQPHAHRV